jgi:hypothetical protein
VYSGYIDKANRAADEQLLAAINTAYAAACLENGTDMALLKDMGGASMPLEKNSDGNRMVKLSGVAPFGEAFARYYAGNEAAAFKFFTSIVYSPSLGMFCNSATAPDMLVGGYMVSGAALAAFQGGALGEMSGTEIRDLVAGLATELGTEGFAENALPAALASGAFQQAALELLGVSGTYEDYMQEKENAVREQFLKEYQAEHPGFDPNSFGPEVDAYWAAADAAVAEQRNNLEKNMLILVGASKAEEASAGLVDILKGNDAYNTLYNNVAGTNGADSALGAGQSALAYSLYASYCQREGKTADTAGFKNALLGGDTGFNTYLTKESDVQADLNSAQAAMGVIGSQDPTILENTVEKGLNNEDLLGALTQILGK